MAAFLAATVRAAAVMSVQQLDKALIGRGSALTALHQYQRLHSTVPVRGLSTIKASAVPNPASGPGPSEGDKHICVLGAGVAGMTCAVQLLGAMPEARVTVVAEWMDGDTCSHGAGGLGKPYTLGETPAELVNKWGKATLDHYMQLYFSPEAGEAGVMLTSAYQLWKQPIPDPEWASVVPHFRHLTPRELQLYDPTASHAHGWFFTTTIAEGQLYTSWLMARFRALGGATQCRRVASLQELADFDLIVNCSGLGARDLFGDASMYPVRGQVLRVKAPWIRHYTNADGECYIIPNTDTVVLGGTLGKGDFDVAPRQGDSDGILARCTAVMPSLKAAKVEKVWVGLRPGRPSVRLEAEQLEVGSRTLPVVHNYGHGGAGLTLAWGCSLDVVQLVRSL